MIAFNLKIVQKSPFQHANIKKDHNSSIIIETNAFLAITGEVITQLACSGTLPSSVRVPLHITICIICNVFIPNMFNDAFHFIYMKIIQILLHDVAVLDRRTIISMFIYSLSPQNDFPRKLVHLFNS